MSRAPLWPCVALSDTGVACCAVVVIGYSRSWLRRPEVGLRIRQSDWDRLDEEGQSLLRFEQVVPDSEFGPTRGEGWSPTYDSAALEKASGASYRQHDDV